ncbi:cation channel sperm-associated protein subunit beta protein family-domain-containing protein [Zopfochytrium polystomum]|nr:cation channel sperm-associated protein subunit beta protein family-domain-containing protein [Zopfochytrium polystomum]
MRASVDCLDPSESFVYVGFDTMGSGLTSNLIFTTPKGTSGAWSSPLSPNSFGLDKTYMFLASVRHTPSSTHLFLFGQVQTGCGSATCGKSAAVGRLNSLTGVYSMSFTFPPSFLAVGMELHGNGFDLYAFGTELWHSVDGGGTWLRVHSLPQTAGTLLFARFRSARQGELFSLLASDYSVFFGDTSSRALGSGSTVRHGTNGLIDLYSDTFGVPSVLEFDYTTSYPAAGSYPMGFLKLPNGAIRDADDPFIRKYPIPVRSVASTTDFAIPAALVPVYTGPKSLQLFAYSSDNSARFSPVHTGLVVKQRDGGQVLITSISASGYVANGIIRAPLVGATSTVSPALQFDLNFQGVSALTDLSNGDIVEPVATSSTVTLSLTSANAPTGGWRQSDVGKTVVANLGSFVIAQITSSTAAVAVMVRAPTSISVVSTGSWAIYDFRSFIESALSTSQTVTIGSISAKQAVVTISNGEMTFDDSAVGLYLAVSDNWGVVLDVLTTTTVKVGFFLTPTATTYAAGSWSLFDASPGQIATTFPGLKYRTRPWNLTLDACPWSTAEHTDAIQESVHYLDFASSLSMQSVVRTNVDAALQVQQFVRFTAMSSNPTGNSYSFLQSSWPGGTLASSLLNVQDTGSTSRSVVSVRPQASTLLCSRGTETFTIVNGCPPTRFIRLATDYTPDEFLHGNLVFLGDLPRVQFLPFNYRPPSQYGVSVPTTDNMYNANPAAPRYNDRFSAAKQTGTYKKCAGKATREDCHCTDADRASMLVAKSDCIDAVEKVIYDDPYVPQVNVYEFGRDPALYMRPYRLVELNNRTDYCLSAGGGTCGNTTVLSAAIMDPTKNDKVYWKGSELYHFRVIVAGQEYCALSTEFAVFVILEPPRTSIVITAMSAAAVGFAIFLLLAYLLYYYKQASVW